MDERTRRSGRTGWGAALVLAAVAAAPAPARAGSGAATNAPPPRTDRSPWLPAGVAEVAATTIAQGGGDDRRFEAMVLQLDGRYGLGGLEPLVGVLLRSGLQLPQPPTEVDVHAGVRVPVTRMSSLRIIGWWRWPTQRVVRSRAYEADLVEAHDMGFDAIYEIRYPFVVSSRAADRGHHVFALVGELGGGFDRSHLRWLEPLSDPSMPIPSGYSFGEWVLHLSAGIATQLTPRTAIELGAATGELREQEISGLHVYATVSYARDRFELVVRGATTSFDLSRPDWQDLPARSADFEVGAVVVARM